MKKKNYIALVIDDEEDICFLLGNLLKQKEYVVVLSHRLKDGLAQLIFYEPDLVFLDLHLPDGFGLDYIRPIREHFPQTKIIVMSAFDGTEETIAESSGADVYLRKPLNHDGVMESIMKINV